MTVRIGTHVSSFNITLSYGVPNESHSKNYIVKWVDDVCVCVCIQLCIIAVDYTLKICQSFIYTCQEYKYTMLAESDGKITITMSVLMLKPMASPYIVYGVTNSTRLWMKMK